MNNTIVLIVIVSFIFLYFYAMKQENFSDSGVAISNDYLERLFATYIVPQCGGDNACVQRRAKNILGYNRRHSIDSETGNYFTVGGMLH